MTADDEELGPAAARRVVRGALLAGAGFAVCTVWSVTAAPGPSTRPEPAPLTAARAPSAESPARAEPAIPTVQVQRTVPVTPPRRLPGLPGLRLGYLGGQDMVVGNIAVDEVLRGTPAVKVVNLWATWCPPCVRENRLFLERSKGWRREVRFVPIHVGAISDFAAYRTLVDQMPAAAVSPLVDGSGDAIQSLLRAEKLLAAAEGIPITLVLDCRNELRWLHVGEVKDGEALDAEISRLRTELGSARCAVEPGRPPGCGDGTCAEPGEHCDNCPDDCGCNTPGTVCRTAPNREVPHCAFPDSAFNEGS